MDGCSHLQDVRGLLTSVQDSWRRVEGWLAPEGENGVCFMLCHLGEFIGGGTYKVKMEANFLFLSLVLFGRFLSWKKENQRLTAHERTRELLLRTGLEPRSRSSSKPGHIATCSVNPLSLSLAIGFLYGVFASFDKSTLLVPFDLLTTTVFLVPKPEAA